MVDILITEAMYGTIVINDLTRRLPQQQKRANYTSWDTLLVIAEHGPVKVRRCFKDMKPFILPFLYISSTILDKNTYKNKKIEHSCPTDKWDSNICQIESKLLLSSVVGLLSDIILSMGNNETYFHLHIVV